MQTPVSLLDRLRQPEEDGFAWPRFVELYTPVIFGWARHLGLSVNDASDLVQEIFVLLVEKLPAFRYDPQKSFRAWLKTLTLNRWRDIQRRRTPQGSPELLEKVAVESQDDPFWEKEYRQHLVGQALQIMQREFEQSTWRACWECVVQGRSPTEVANELGITVNAVYLAKSRVLRRLHQELAGLLG